jgi:hypothetical protein
MTNGDQILRAYATLSSLRDNIPEGYKVHEKWVHEYNGAIEKLEKALGIDLTDFKVPNNELKRSKASGNRDGLWCERAILMQKLASTLAYFTGLQGGQERQIGFRPS